MTPLPNLRHLSLFCAIARLGSVSAAARSVYLSQPAVTQAVGSLEASFGGALFTRTTQGMELTEAGRLCATRVSSALERMEAAITAVASQPLRRGGVAVTHRITARQLQALVAAVEAGGFGPAARLVSMTRATIQRAARQLEKRVGVPLFEATSHGLRPTREALRLGLQVQLAVAELAQARAEIAATIGADTGQTVIGAMPLGRSFIVPETVLRFAARRPQHRVSILDGPYENLLDALRRGRADVLVGALREQIPPDVLQEPMFDDPLAIIVRRGHPLEKISGGSRRAPPAEALFDFSWIAPRASSPLRRHFERLFTDLNALPPAAAIECNSLIAARALLLRSDRVMLLSAQQAHHELAAGELVALPHPAGRVVRRIGLTLRRDWQPTAAQGELLDILRQVAKACRASES